LTERSASSKPGVSATATAHGGRSGAAQHVLSPSGRAPWQEQDGNRGEGTGSTRPVNRIAGYPERPVATAVTLPLARQINHGAYMATKRALDTTAALAFLVLFAPVLLLIALLIWREDGGPVLYSQERVGKDGRLFRFYKFRSMVKNADQLKAQLADENEAEGPIFKIKEDPRITRVGRVLRKYSLDELPQFANVLRGDMSLVGPRPHLPTEIEEYCQSGPGYPWVRLSVPPGLICLREVSGRSRLSFERWLELDLIYVEFRSLWVDLWILARAVPAVLKGDGAF
jgi:lipopolysaccharide/colanic/teichoic acid biosynthesis glycosyltransferase